MKVRASPISQGSNTLILIQASGNVASSPLLLPDANQNYNTLHPDYLFLPIPTSGNGQYLLNGTVGIWTLDQFGADIQQIVNVNTSNWFSYENNNGTTMAISLYKTTGKLVYGFRWAISGTASVSGPVGSMVLQPGSLTNYS